MKDFLPQKLKTARVLLFGYNANVAFQTSTSGVSDHAVNLLNRLKFKRQVRIATEFLYHFLAKENIGLRRETYYIHMS